MHKNNVCTPRLQKLVTSLYLLKTAAKHSSISLMVTFTCTLVCVQYMQYIVYTVCTVFCTMYVYCMYYILYSVYCMYCILHDVRTYTVCTIFCIVYTVCTVFCIMYTVCTVLVPLLPLKSRQPLSSGYNRWSHVSSTERIHCITTKTTSCTYIVVRTPLW